MNAGMLLLNKGRGAAVRPVVTAGEDVLYPSSGADGRCGSASGRLATFYANSGARPARLSFSGSRARGEGVRARVVRLIRGVCRGARP